MVLRIFESGLHDDLPSDLAISLRATNMTSLVGAFIAPMGAFGWYFGAGMPEMAIAMLLFSIFLFFCFFLNMTGAYNSARFCMILGAGVGFTLVGLVTDFSAGFHFNFVIIFVLPFIVFTIKEKFKIVLTISLAFAFLIVTIIGQVYYNTSLIDSRDVALKMSISNLVLLSFVIASIVVYYVYKVQADLEREKQKTEGILRRTMPERIAERLKADEKTIADSHGEAAILFADIVGFSELSSRVSPGHLVEMLNELFSEFDDLAKKHSVEKIKTIGDCYMAAGGVVKADSEQPSAVANLALEIVEAVESASKIHGYPLKVRVGMHIGQVISGVIGSDRYTFDLWGDTVNVASRLESSGVPGRIHVSEVVFWRLKNVFEFEERGEVNLKGKKESFLTYFLQSPKQDREFDDSKGNVIDLQKGVVALPSEKKSSSI